MQKRAFGAAMLALAALAFLLSQAEATPRGDINMSPVPGLVQSAACVKVCSDWAVCWKFGKPRRCCSRFICR